MQKNEDYKRGMKFLLEKSKESNINIRKLWWIPILSKHLSEYDMCYNFWFNTYAQDRIKRIPLASCPHDLFHTSGICLFNWSITEEGHDAWSELKTKLFPNKKIEHTLFEKIW